MRLELGVKQNQKSKVENQSDRIKEAPRNDR
jgi:hypothetical protein